VFILDYCAQAFSNYKAAAYKNIRKVIGDMFMSPFRGNSLDIVFSYSTFHSIGSEEIAKKMMRGWCALLKSGGILYIGDIPDRGRLGYILKSTFKTVIQNPSKIKYFFGITMNSYFSKDALARYLGSLDMEVEIIEQPESLLLHKERFDLKAVKRS
jgi:SAM-dependent methyltransferase